MFHYTKAAARAWLDAGNFVPRLKAAHKIIRTTRKRVLDWDAPELTIIEETGYTVVLS